MTVIPEDFVDYLEGGVSLLVGTRDAQNRPDVTRAMGASVSADRRSIVVYVPERWSAGSLANVAANGEVAVGFSRPIDNLSLQLKGGGARIVPPNEQGRAVVLRYHASYIEQLTMIGMPRSTLKRLSFWPAVGIEFTVRDVFLQTPGPEAGKRLGEGATR